MKEAKISSTKEQNIIEIKGARVNNLKNLSVNIPTNKLVVITGLSGSGKSSLAFDTLYAEGQRRYVESLSAYARQFLGRINKPEVDSIKGIAPAIAIEQKVSSKNPRSTVGTTTEIYEYLKLLFAKAGETFSPISGRKVVCHSVDNIINHISQLPKSGVVYITAPISLKKDYLIEKVVELMSEGYDSLFYQNREIDIAEFMSQIDNIDTTTIYSIIAKIPLNQTISNMEFSDSVSTALEIGNKHISIFHKNDKGGLSQEDFSTSFEADGITFEQPFEQMFSFNNPLGACPLCSGSGRITGIDEELVIPDKSKSVFGDAVAAWRGEISSKFKNQIIDSYEKTKFPIHKPYCDLSEKDRKLLWSGCAHFAGIDGYFAMLEKERYKIQCRVIIARYTGNRVCTECDGSRLKKESLYVKVGGYNISELTKLSVEKLQITLNNLELTKYQQEVSKRVLTEIKNRIGYLIDVGLGYLTLNRLSSTLSGGESQRINLASSLGSSLVGTIYILDEPSIGLHPRDTDRLISVLKKLRDIGNSVVVVEHDEAIMREADQIIDIGPLAGEFGGELVFQGNISEIADAKNSLTADYLLGRKTISPKTTPRKWDRFIEIKGARENNLKNIDVKFPLGVMCCVTGVSGSGKSSLVKDILYPAVHRHCNEMGKNIFNYDALSGNLSDIKNIEIIDQNPIGKSSRSNPVTYIKAYDDIRKLFSSLPMSKSMGLTPSSFSFNIAGGRCEECEGEGITRVKMQFMADVIIPCEACGGKRFKEEICRITYRDKNITDILDMSVSESIKFFSVEKGNNRIVEKLKVLEDVGLGYIKLGQSSSSLSGGESQRVKLASFLIKENNTTPTMFIFDEPTTGLHYDDIKKLLKSLNRLIDNGHSVVIVEHNIDVIKSCDWVIDLGPEGGEKGGSLIFCGTPNQLSVTNLGYTCNFIKKNLVNKK